MSKISILLPAKNAGLYLRACLDSILAQDHQRWELIAIDDHSEDDTLELLKEYQSKDPRIKVFQNIGKGIIPALRLAFKKSTASMITRMDADDLMAPSKLKLMAELLSQSGPRHLILGLVKYIADFPIGEGYAKYEKWLNDLSLQEKNWDEIYKECVVPSPCWMCTRKDFLKAGAFDTEIYPEDYDLCFRFRKSGLKIKTVPEVLHFWRDHPKRSSRTDPNYADNTFLELKLHHFKSEDYDAAKPLVLIGAGKKGKAIAKLLIGQEIPFSWTSNNKNKIGRDIYGTIIESQEFLKNLKEGQVIIAVAVETDQAEIRSLLNETSSDELRQFWFC